MPIIKEIHEPSYSLALWHITESKDFFLKYLTDPVLLSEFHSISNNEKQLEFLASRYLVYQLLDVAEPFSLKKHQNGGPYFENLSKSISISHTRNFAAVLISNTKRCGIDIEILHPRVKKIANRFLSESEKMFVHPETEIETLTLFWSVKETVFKWYTEGNLSFSKHIKLPDYFKLSNRGTLYCQLILPNTIHNVEVFYEQIDNLILSYAV